LEGCELQKADGGDYDDWSSALFTFGAGHIIPAKGYFLIAECSPCYNGPPADAVATLVLGNAPDSVRLTWGSDAVLDVVGWGDEGDFVQTDYYELHPAVDASDSKSLERKSGATHKETHGNAWDTDDNLNNFLVRETPQPQNSDCGPEPDTVVPGIVTALSALSGASEGWIELNWTAPGDDGTSNDNDWWAGYVVKYSTQDIQNDFSGDTTAWWSDNNTSTFTPSLSWSVSGQGVLEQKINLSGFTAGTSYYFAIKSCDGTLFNWSSIDKLSEDNDGASQVWACATPGPPPAEITNLSAIAISGSICGAVKLSWTAPDEDTPNPSGEPVSLYDIRYATKTFAVGDWDKAFVKQVSGEPTPASPGITEKFTVSGLSGGTPAPHLLCRASTLLFPKFRHRETILLIQLRMNL